jgi:hypothetical protein
MNEQLQTTKAALEKQADVGIELYRPSQRIDNFLFNWGTGLAILLNSFATMVPPIAHAAVFWFGKVAGAIATAWIAIDRLLAFQMRWRFSLSQQGRFRAVRARLQTVELLPDGEQQRKLQDLAEELAVLFARDESFPCGAGPAPDDGAAFPQGHGPVT